MSQLLLFLEASPELLGCIGIHVLPSSYVNPTAVLQGALLGEEGMKGPQSITVHELWWSPVDNRP
jgi:hypothetical protein